MAHISLPELQALSYHVHHKLQIEFQNIQFSNLKFKIKSSKLPPYGGSLHGTVNGCRSAVDEGMQQ